MGGRKVSLLLGLLLAGGLLTPNSVSAAEYNWSGWYVTATAGYGWRHQNTYPSQAYYESLGANFAAGAGYGGTSGASGPTKTDGFTFSLGFGYNYQVGMIVLGADYEFIYADIANGPVPGQTSFTNGTGILANGYVATNFDTADGDNNKWYGVARVKAGPAFGRFLPYVTGGAAYRLSYATTNPMITTFTYSGIGTPPNSSSVTYTGINRANAWGWVLGLGLEYALTDDIMIKGEWLHLDFGNDTYLDPVATALTGAVVTRGFRREADLVRVGASYRFNWGGGSSTY
jgi:outer membrane immunogenic protein